MIRAYLTLFILILIFPVSVTYAGGGGGPVVTQEQEKAAAAIMSKTLAAASATKPNRQAINIVQAVPLTINTGVAEACLGGSGCSTVFNAVVLHLKKLLTPSYRKQHSIHIFNPNKLKYSTELAQSMAKISLLQLSKITK